MDQNARLNAARYSLMTAMIKVDHADMEGNDQDADMERKLRAARVALNHVYAQLDDYQGDI